MANTFVDVTKGSVVEQFSTPPPIGLYIWIIGIFVLVILGVVLLVNLNIFLMLKIKKLKRELDIKP